MKHKIFIAINFSDRVKEKMMLFQNLDEVSILPMSWDNKENLHLTLNFLGVFDNDSLYELTKRLHKIAENINPFLINFNKIIAGPPNEKAKMLWLLSEKNPELEKLKDTIKNTSSDLVRKKEKKQDFIAHITLGKILRIEDDVKMPNLDVALKASVESIEIMESVREKGRVSYITLEKIDFGLQEY